MSKPTAREAELLAIIAERDQEIKLLKAKIDLLIRKLFGVSSEKLDPQQLELLLEGKESPPPPKKEPEPGEEVEFPQCSKDESTPRRRNGPKLPENLPVVEEEILPEEVKANPQGWQRTGLTPEISERLDYEPARFLLIRSIRPKFVRRGEAGAAPVIAPLPPCLLEKSLVTPGLLAQVVVGKYCDHLPLYRQEDIFWRRHNVWLPRQTMAEWVLLASEWLKPIYQEICKEVTAAGYLQVDETAVRYQAPGNKKTKLGYLWTALDPKTRQTIYQWNPSRAAGCLEKIIPVNFKGIIQCDGYEAYDCFARRRETITLAGCMAHVRRKIKDASPEKSRTAAWFLKQIQNLYGIESRLRKGRAGPRYREAIRASESRPIMERLKKACVLLLERKRVLPKSELGKAISYALSQWEALECFLQDGRVEIDNNLVENAIRPTAVGKKNWLFVGRAGAGERTAIIYTVIESCRRYGINPFAYLKDVFTRLPASTTKIIPELTPKAWAASSRPDFTKLAA